MKPLPLAAAEAMARAFIEDQRLETDSSFQPDDIVDGPFLERVVGLCGFDPMLIHLLTRTGIGRDVVSSLFSENSNLQAASEDSRTTADDIFLHPQLLGGDNDCLLLVACLCPLLPTYGSYFPVDLAWVLARDPLARKVRDDMTAEKLQSAGRLVKKASKLHLKTGDREEEEVVSLCKERFVAAWKKLLSCGWLQCDPYSHRRATVSRAAVCALRLLERAYGLFSTDTSVMQVQQQQQQQQVQWNLYYEFWAKFAHRMSERLRQHGFSVAANGRSGDYIFYPSMLERVSDPEEDMIYEPFGVGTRELLNEADEVMPHLFRLLSVWLDTSAPLQGGRGLALPAADADSVMHSRSMSIDSDFDNAEMLPVTVTAFPVGISSASRMRQGKAKDPDQRAGSGPPPTLGPPLKGSKEIGIGSGGKAGSSFLSPTGKGGEYFEFDNPMRAMMASKRATRTGDDSDGQAAQDASFLTPSVGDEAAALRKKLRLREKKLEEYMTSGKPQAAAPGRRSERRSRRSQRREKLLKHLQLQQPSDVDAAASQLGGEVALLLSVRWPSFRAVEILRNIANAMRSYSAIFGDDVPASLVQCQTGLGDMLTMLEEGYEAAEPVLREAATNAELLVDADEKAFYGVYSLFRLSRSLLRNGNSRDGQLSLEQVLYRTRVQLDTLESRARDSKGEPAEEDSDSALNSIAAMDRSTLDVLALLSGGPLIPGIAAPGSPEVPGPLSPGIALSLSPTATSASLLTIKDGTASDAATSFAAKQSRQLLLRLRMLLPDALAMLADALAMNSIVDPLDPPPTPYDDLAGSADSADSADGSEDQRLVAANGINTLPMPMGGGAGLVSPVTKERMRHEKGRREQRKKAARSEGARVLYAEAVERYQSLYGPASVRAGEMHTAIGDLFCAQERYEDAQEQYEAALLSFKPRYDGPQARTAYALVGLSVAMRVAKRESLARRLLEEALFILRAVYPDEHPKVTSAANNLATLLTGQMRYDRAIALHQQSLAAAKLAVGRARGVEQREAASAAIPPILVTIAALHDQTQRHALAVPLYQEALTLYRDIYGYHHMTVADTLCLLAESTSREYEDPAEDIRGSGQSVVNPVEVLLKGRAQLNRSEDDSRYVEAKQFLDEAMDIYRELGKTHSHHSVKVLKQLALLQEDFGHFESARECYEKIEKIYVSMKIGHCEELADTYVAFGRVQAQAGDPQDAQTLFSQALATYSKLFGEVHVKIADTMTALGAVHIDLHSYEEAQPYFEKAMVLYAEILGSECTQIGDCHSCKGFIHQQLDEYDEAASEYRMALALYVRARGKYHADVANSLNNIATLLDDMDEKESAKRFYEHALEVLHKVHGRLHPQVALTTQNLATLLEDMGLHSEATQRHKEVAEIEDKLTRDPATVRASVAAAVAAMSSASKSRRDEPTSRHPAQEGGDEKKEEEMEPITPAVPVPAPAPASGSRSGFSLFGMHFGGETASSYYDDDALMS